MNIAKAKWSNFSRGL